MKRDREFKSRLDRQPVCTFCLHFGEDRNSARNVAFFLPAVHRREPAHAGFARFGEHSLRAKYNFIWSISTLRARLWIPHSEGKP
jgi:hypothetical protein